MYSTEELSTSLIIEGTSRSKRQPLDTIRLETIKTALFAKYNVAPARQPTYWNDVLSSAKKCVLRYNSTKKGAR